jgi:GT2 family glycosyltransferase
MRPGIPRFVSQLLGSRANKSRAFLNARARKRVADPELLDKIASSILFDQDYYEFRYPDLGDVSGGSLLHFYRHGMKERRDTSPYFSIHMFMSDHYSIKKLSEAPFLDAIEAYSEEELRSRWLPRDDLAFSYLLLRSGLFDREWYLTRNSDVASSGADPFTHFVERGAYEQRDPGPRFDSLYYRDANRDHRLYGRTPIESYLLHGQRVGLATIGGPIYSRWIARFDELTSADLTRLQLAATSQRTRAAGVLVVQRGPDPEFFRRVVCSWADQMGADWDVRVVRGAAVEDSAWRDCRDALSVHPGLQIRDVEAAFEDLAADTAVLLGTSECLLRPHAALVLADAMRHQGAAAAYSDHDHEQNGTRTQPVYKPDYSPEFLRRLPYPGALVVAKVTKEATEALQEAAAGASAPTAWARLLLGLEATGVARVPFVLFQLLEGASVDWDGICEPVPTSSGAHLLPVELRADPPSVAIIIPTRDHGDLLRECVESIDASTDYPSDCVSFVIVDNGTTDPKTLALLGRYELRPRSKVVRFPGAFNFSAICNAGASASEAEMLVFLNNDTTVNRPDWLARIVEQLVKPETGVVGAQLLYPDGTVQHAGVVLGVQGLAAHRMTGMTRDEAAARDVTREMTAVTGACLGVKRSVFSELGGFDPVLGIAFNDMDLCARSVESGFRNLYVAEPLLFHHESKSRGYDLTRVDQHRNTREAIYARGRHADLVRDDPSYSPNLSLSRIGQLAFPPRAVRPWRRSQPGTKRILLLSVVHGLGHGVATVVAEQAATFLSRGWEVVIGGPPAKREPAYAGCRRIHLWDADDAAACAVEEGLDCVMAHTPPFFSIVRHLGAWPLVYATDHGEPPPYLFEDAQAREDVNWEKRFCAPMLRRVFAISQSVYASQYRKDAIVVRNGNTHLDTWSEDWAGRRRDLRAKFGFGDRFVVLNVCRFGVAERRYKGIVHYGEVASDLVYLHPNIVGRVVFVLAGRGDEEDVAYATSLGLTVFPNLTDAEITELYVAADLYMSLSAWEGYNLGIGQALALGLDVVASDTEAHREFGVETKSSVPDFCEAVARRAARFDETAQGRHAVVQPWADPLTRMAETVEADLDETREVWRI